MAGVAALKLLPKRKGRKDKIRVASFPDAAARDEYLACGPLNGARGFRRWLRGHAKIQDAISKKEVYFDPFPGQDRLIGPMVAGFWLIGLKGRQLGATWLSAAYTCWRLTYSQVFRAVCINQELQYAKDFIKRVNWIHDRLEPWFQQEVTTDNKLHMAMEGGGASREIRALVGSENAGRSITGDLVIFDEASRIPDFYDTLGATLPGVESAKGQIIVLTTSSGPAGDFYNLWQETYGDHGELLSDNGVGPTGFKAFFIHWSERPGRDGDWYNEQAARLAPISPVMVKQEYPNNPEEAFEHAAGRIYPLLTRDRCLGTVSIHEDTPRYRAVDWGETKSAYVVLWIAHIKGPPGLIISPNCPNTMREMLAYRWDEDRPGHPNKMDDHAPDALRYAVCNFRMTGLVYVYREIYRKESLAKGWNPMKEIQEIHEASGWVPASPQSRKKWKRGRTGEKITGTVCDRSWGKMIALFCDNQIPCEGQRKLRRPNPPKGEGGADLEVGEVQEGIRMVSILVDGTLEVDKVIEVTRDTQALYVLREHERLRSSVHHTVGLRERRLHQIARDLLERNERR